MTTASETRHGDATYAVEHSHGLSASAVSKFAVYLIVLIAFALRIFRLGQQSLWYDEGFSIYLASQDLATITSRTAADIHPPLYYYLLHYWLSAVGNSEFAARYLSLLWGMLLIPTLYVLTGKVFTLFRPKRLSAAKPADSSIAEESMSGYKLGFMAGSVAILVGLLAGINPALVWYSQEARMYSLLMFSTLLGCYCFFDLLSEPKLGGGKLRAGIMSLVLVIANVAAIYAHFYAFFVIAAEITFLTIWCLADARGHIKQTLRLAGLFLLVCISYLPWAGFVAARLSADVSYYQGILEPSIVFSQTLDMFVTGVSLDENTPGLPAILVLLVAIVGVVVMALGDKHERDRRQGVLPFLFLALWLIIPFFLLFAVSYSRPKFHPRYLLIALPPFLIFTAIAGPWLYQRLKSRLGVSISALLSAIALAIPVYMSMQSLGEMYFDGKFARDDWRGASAFLSKQVTDSDAVILISGHAFPVFTYYYAKGNWTPVPDEITLSTENTLNYNIANTLNDVVDEKTSLWVVRWQDNVVDPNGFLKRQLEDNAQRIEVPQSFKGLALDHYLVPQGVKFNAEPNIQRKVSINYENKIRLMGFDASELGSGKDQPLRAVSGKTIDLTLYWQAVSKLADDYSVSLRLRDSENHFWGRIDRRPTNYYFPTQRWKTGEIVFGDYKLPVLPGTPPGEYIVEAEIYRQGSSGNEGLSVLDEFGAPAGNSGVLGRITIETPVTPLQVESMGIQRAIGERFRGLEFLGYNETALREVKQGSSFPLVLFWRAAEKMAEDVTFAIDLVADDGSVIGSARYQPAKNEYRTSAWQVGEIIRGQYDVRVPANARSGDSIVRLSILAGDTVLGPSIPLSKISVVERPRSTSMPPTIQNPLDITYGGSIRLIGYDIEPLRRQLKRGETLTLTLYWEAQKDVPSSLVVFNHLLDATGRVVAQHDGVPNGGLSPTVSWLEGEVVTDMHKIVVKSDSPTGALTIETGLYEPSTGVRWRTSTGDDRLLFGEVRVE